MSRDPQLIDPALVSSPPRPTRVRYGVMGFLLVLSFLTYFDRVCIVRVQGEMQRELHLDDVQFGWVFGAFWLAYALFEIPGGWLGDQNGSRRTLTRIVLAWSVCTVLTGFAAGFWSLLAFRFLFGIGEAGAYPNMARIQASWLPKESRARAGGLLWLAARWGGAFAPFLFAGLLRLIDHPSVRQALPFLAGTSSWRLGFMIAGLVGLVWCVLFFGWFRDDPAAKPAVNPAELALIRAGGTAVPRNHAPAPNGVWRSLLRSRSLWAMAALYFLASFGWSFFVSWMPRYLKEVHGLQFDASQSLWMQPLFYGGISCLVGGVLSDRLVRATGWTWFGRAVFPMVGLTTAAAAMYAVRFVSRPEQAIFLICLAGAAYDFGQGANWASIVNIGGRYAGTAMGFINMLGNFSNAASPRTGVWVFQRYGWDALFTVYVGMFLAAATMWLLIDPRRTFHPEPEPENLC